MSMPPLSKVRELRGDGLSYRRIAEMYGVKIEDLYRATHHEVIDLTEDQEVEVDEPVAQGR